MKSKIAIIVAISLLGLLSQARQATKSEIKALCLISNHVLKNTRPELTVDMKKCLSNKEIQAKQSSIDSSLTRLDGKIRLSGPTNTVTNDMIVTIDYKNNGNSYRVEEINYNIERSIYFGNPESPF